MIQECNNASARKNAVKLTHIGPEHYSFLAIIYSL